MNRLARNSQPTIVYIHPRDLAPDVPHVAMPPHRKFMTYVGTKRARDKVARLLQEYDWAPCEEVLEPLIER